MKSLEQFTAYINTNSSYKQYIIYSFARCLNIKHFSRLLQLVFSPLTFFLLLLVPLI